MTQDINEQVDIIDFNQKELTKVVEENHHAIKGLLDRELSQTKSIKFWMGTVIVIGAFQLLEMMFILAYTFRLGYP